MTDIPTLDALAADPGLVRELPAPVAYHLLVQVTSLLPLLVAHAHTPTTEKPQQDNRLLSVAEAAVQLHVSKGRIYELVRHGQLPAVRIGKYVRLEPAVLAKWTTAMRA